MDSEEEKKQWPADENEGAPADQPAGGKSEKKNGKSGFGRGFLLGAVSMLAVGVAVILLGGPFLASHGILKVGSYGTRGGVTSGLNRTRVDQKLDLLQQYVDEEYLFTDRVDDTAMEDGIYKGFVDSLGDEYTVYYSADEAQDLTDSLTGSYVGIGAVVSQDPTTKEVTILYIYEGSPAEKAGMQVGDILQKVDDKEVTDYDLDILVSDYIRGEKGTHVMLTVYRPSTGETLELDTVRDEVVIPYLDYRLDGDIGIIQVVQFDGEVADQFKEAVDDLQNQGMKKLIVDLRNNPGGELNSVLTMIDYLLPDGKTMLSIKDKNGVGDTYTSEDGHSVEIPTVVLVNGQSASASEVFTGAMKDNGAATIVGTQTFGKGIVQSVFQLSDGSMLKITTDHYYTPNGTDIHGTGITPDVEVELDESAAGDSGVTEEEDNQLQKAKEILGAGE